MHQGRPGWPQARPCLGSMRPAKFMTQGAQCHARHAKPFRTSQSVPVVASVVVRGSRRLRGLTGGLSVAVRVVHRVFQLPFPARVCGGVLVGAGAGAGAG